MPFFKCVLIVMAVMIIGTVLCLLCDRIWWWFKRYTPEYTPEWMQAVVLFVFFVVLVEFLLWLNFNGGAR